MTEMTPFALIMAGGQGTRMARSHPSLPKPLVTLCGIPLIDITIHQLLRAGIRDIRLALRHGAQRIIAHLENGARFERAELTFLVEEEPLGTIGALAGLPAASRPVLVTNGDLLSGIDVKAMLRFHRRHGGALTIATHLEHHRLKLGEVVTGPDHRIVEYREKPVKEYRISSGTYFVEPAVLALMARKEWLAFPTLVRRALEAGLPVVDYFHAEPWLDINDQDDLVQAAEMLRQDPAAFGIDPDRLE